MKNSFISACVTLTIMFGCLMLLQNKLQQDIEANTMSVNYVGEKVNEVSKNISAMRAESMEAVSRRELDNAYVSIEDNKKFIEYEINLSRKSLFEFVEKLNQDMERLNEAINTAMKNDQAFQEHMEYVLKELSSPEAEIEADDLLDAPVIVEEVIEDTVVAVVKEEPAGINIQEECSYALQKSARNKTTVIQRAVNKVRRKGTYNLTVLFDVNTEGKAVIGSVNSDTAPSRLKKAVQSYVSQLKFVAKDTLQSNCEMSFNLNVT